MQCYMPTTGIFIITDTFQYIPKAFYFPMTTIDDYTQQVIRDKIANMKDPPKTLPFCFMVMQQKMHSIRLTTVFKEAQLRPVYKLYC